MPQNISCDVYLSPNTKRHNNAHNMNLIQVHGAKPTSTSPSASPACKKIYSLPSKYSFVFFPRLEFGFVWRACKLKSWQLTAILKNASFFSSISLYFTLDHECSFLMPNNRGHNLQDVGKKRLETCACPKLHLETWTSWRRQRARGCCPQTVTSTVKPIFHDTFDWPIEDSLYSTHKKTSVLLLFFLYKKRQKTFHNLLHAPLRNSRQCIPPRLTLLERLTKTPKPTIPLAEIQALAFIPMEWTFAFCLKVVTAMCT